VYRESNHTAIKRTWWSVASDIDELKALAEKLSKEDGGQKARLLSSKIVAAIPRFEATEEVRSTQNHRFEATLTFLLEAKTPRIQTNTQESVQASRA
jgi:hypothetical protein